MTVRRFAIVAFFGLAAVAAIGIGLVVSGNELAGWFLLILAAFFALVNGALIWASRQRLVVGGELELTGKVLGRGQPGGATWDPKQRAWAWTGGGNVPTAPFGRSGATMPLAVLEFRPTSLTMRFRPRLLTTSSPCWKRDDVENIYPVRGRWFRGTRGIAITTKKTRSYFWTFAAGSILASLELEGYPVSWDERYLRTWS